MSIPAKDVRIYRFERKNYSGVDAVAVDNDNAVTLHVSGGTINIEASSPMSSINVYGIDGTAINSLNFATADVTNTSIPAGLSHGIAIVSVRFASGATCAKKVILK